MKLTPEQLLKQVEKDFPNIEWSHFDGELVVSESRVMKSAAGYYIGRSCVEEMEDGFLLPQPYSRESHWYWATKEEAQAMLDSYK